MELWAVVGQKHQTFWGLRTLFPPRDIHKNPCSMCARAPQAMAQFVLKIEKLSHIMGTAPIVELACAYGLHPRLWLLALRCFIPFVRSFAHSFIRWYVSSLARSLVRTFVRSFVRSFIHSFIHSLLRTLNELEVPLTHPLWVHPWPSPPPEP